jgi:hypothetical protein
LKIDQLVCSRWLNWVAGERLSAAEVICRMAMTSGLAMPREAHQREAFKTTMAAAIARTGAVFVVDVNDWVGLMDSVDWQPEELPPWPYPRCWLEVYDETLDGPGGFTAVTTFDGQEKGVVAYAVYEEVPAAKWMIAALLMDAEGDVSLESWETRPPPPSDGQPETGTVYLGGTAPFDEMPESERLRWVAMFDAPIVLAQIVTTVGGRLPAVPIPRAESRRFQRRWGLEHPNVYRVDLRSVGDEFPGKGDRQFRHRWLVRGHYRRHETGRYMVPGKGPCTWVRAFVKGPQGAPWKGRPIYTTGDIVAR